MTRSPKRYGDRRDEMQEEEPKAESPKSTSTMMLEVPETCFRSVILKCAATAVLRNDKCVDMDF